MFVFQCHVKEEATVLLTKVFRNGNSQTVRIPAEIADTNADIALEIERVDDELRTRPFRLSLAGIQKNSLSSAPTLWQKAAAIRNKPIGKRCDASLYAGYQQVYLFNEAPAGISCPAS